MGDKIKEGAIPAPACDERRYAMKKLFPILLAFSVSVVAVGCGSIGLVPITDNEPVELYFIHQTDDNGNESYKYSVDSGEYELTASLDEI